MMIASLILALQVGPADPPVRATEFEATSPLGHRIAGVVEAPDGAAARPAVVLITGAGAHDRDGYTLRTSRGHNDAFRDLSRRLVALGFAVVRFDEMGTGRSTGDYAATATTATLARDVAAVVKAVRAMAPVDAERVFLIGHSEGGAIAALVAANDARIAGVALLAAPAWTGRRIMEYQLRLAAERHVRSVSFTSADIAEAYLARDAREREASDPWYRFFLDFDPLPAVRRITAPVLVVQGEEDEVVTARQATELATALRKAGNAHVRLHVLSGYAHSFTELRAGAVDPAPLAAEIVSLLEDWLDDPRRGGAVTP